MKTPSIAILALAGSAGLVACGATLVQAPAAVQVSGPEMVEWFARDQMAVAGIGFPNYCHFIVKGPGDARRATLYCPNSAPFTVVGQARIEGNRLCSTFVYPNGTRYEGCQEIFKVGENKYEARVDGVVRNVLYRLIP